MRQNYGAIPESCDVVVIGGGPAGSSAAILLAKEGLDVILIDKVKHPRPMVGESIIPQLWKFADHLGIKKKVEAEGFLVKSGGIITWDGVPRTVLFSDFGYKTKGLHIERDIYDELMLQHAVECGARVYHRRVGHERAARGPAEEPQPHRRPRRP
ncbi:FAD-dependent oxidoreductase [Myxococcota bacterium]|nr:FAD-dependent oxidoreductase [Myxococcota bacterium]